jgi:hypothetical protein
MSHCGPAASWSVGGFVPLAPPHETGGGGASLHSPPDLWPSARCLSPSAPIGGTGEKGKKGTPGGSTTHRPGRYLGTPLRRRPHHRGGPPPAPPGPVGHPCPFFRPFFSGARIHAGPNFLQTIQSAGGHPCPPTVFQSKSLGRFAASAERFAAIICASSEGVGSSAARI